MAALSTRTGVLARTLALPVSLVVAGLLVWQGSNAAFTATTSNPGNSWTAGSVVLTDDDGGTSPTTGTAMFSATNLAPGSTGQRCIAVTSTSNVPSRLRLYTSGVTGTLAPYLDMTIEQGTGGGFGSCTGFTPASPANTFTGTLSALGSSATNFGSGILSIDLPATPPNVRTYRFAYTVSATTPDTLQTATAAATFIWEAQSI
jgi:hypothetical protein